MSTTAAVPVTVTPEAAARVAELGFQKEFDQLVEHARTTIQGVRRIEVKLEPPYDTGDEDKVVLWIRIADPLLNHPSIQEYENWTSRTFSRDVIWHLAAIPTVAEADA